MVRSKKYASSSKIKRGSWWVLDHERGRIIIKVVGTTHKEVHYRFKTHIDLGYTRGKPNYLCKRRFTDFYRPLTSLEAFLEGLNDL